jgi:hypothetical protein
MLLLVHLLLAPRVGWGQGMFPLADSLRALQATPNSGFYPTALTAGYRPVLALANGWQDTETGERLTLPVMQPDRNFFTLEYDFFLRQDPFDTLYIYVPQLAATAEVIVNGNLLLLAEQPYRGWRVPVPPQVLGAQWNQVKLRLLTTSSNRRGLPTQPMIGLLQPVFLLAKNDSTALRYANLDTTLCAEWPLHDSLARLLRPRTLPVADSVVVYAPLLVGGASALTVQQLRDDFLQLQLLDAHNLYTPIALPAWADTLLVAYGLTTVQQPGRYVAAFRAVELQGLPALATWFDADGHLARAVRTYTDTHSMTQLSIGRGMLILSLLLGLVFLVLVKLLAPQAFESLVLGLEGLRQRIDITRPPVRISALARSVLWLLVIVAQSFALLYWARLHQLAHPELLAADAPTFGLLELLRTLNYASNFVVWVALVAGFVLWDGLRLVICTLAERIFGLTGFTAEVLRANVLGSYPLWPVAFFIGLVPFLQAETNWAGWSTTLTVLLVLALLYKVVVVVFAILQFRKLHPVGRLLYICTVEGLPLVFLLG